jgi:tetratricopeptide (TPR) repeat protein
MRAERGEAIYPSSRKILCDYFNKSSRELGLLKVVEEVRYDGRASYEPGQQVLLPEKFESLCTDLDFRVQCMMYEALSRRMSLSELRAKLTSVLVEGNTIMDLARRKLLRYLALIPIQTFGLSALGASGAKEHEDILIHCAAGITACEHLSKGVDLNLAYATVSAYVPTLKSIARDCLMLRKAASELVAQAMLLLAALSLHLESSRAAIGYAQQAVNYSQVSENLELLLTAMGQLAWIFSCDKQYRKALETAQRAESLLKRTEGIHPLVISNTYAVLGAYSAQNGYRDEALVALNIATQMFFTTIPTDGYGYMDYDYSELALTRGLAHIRTGHPQEALDSFAEVVDPTTLAPKIPLSERVRVEFLNHMALASVKNPSRDMEQARKYWLAGVQGAKALQSEQRFNEAFTTYEIMDSVWSGDRRIGDLRELVVHW